MKFTVQVTEAALADQIDAASWYERQREGLGRDFESEVFAASHKLVNGALHHSVRTADVRRAGLRRFASYGLFYIIRAEQVTIFAILHSARNPDYLQRRRRSLG